MSIREQIEAEMKKAGLRTNLGEGWDITVIAVRARERDIKEAQGK